MKQLDKTSVTHVLAKWIVDSRWDDIDATVKASAASSLMNWFACALGGANSSDTNRLIQALTPFGHGCCTNHWS
jgi:2-methylcitrate dehydratase PrpD